MLAALEKSTFKVMICTTSTLTVFSPPIRGVTATGSTPLGGPRIRALQDLDFGHRGGLEPLGVAVGNKEKDGQIEKYLYRVVQASFKDLCTL